jgi:(E)-2-((N-methylformamido)methylene)succinate hydrolase
VDPDVLRRILRRFAAGVTVITSINDASAPVGMTATAFSSVSLDPPMVLVCVNAGARTRHAIEGSTGYGVNILAEGQEAVARQFASSAADKFAGVAWRPGATGVPLIEGALATLECSVVQAVEAGTHIVYIGSVLAGEVPGGEPLVYHDGSYRTLATPPSSA